MSEPTITCPSCKSEIRLTESLAAPLLQQTKAEFRRQLSAKDVEITLREEAVTKSAAELEEQRSATERRWKGQPPARSLSSLEEPPLASSARLAPTRCFRRVPGTTIEAFEIAGAV